jgi:hypothetical protein
VQWVINDKYRESIKERYFCDGTIRTLKCSKGHLLKCGEEWKKVSDINEFDLIETENGLTRLKSLRNGKNEILYDLSVDNVHCYFSNGIVSHNSFSLVHLGAEALKLGYDVVHWTFELDENYVAYRYDAKLTGIALDDLKYNVSDVKKRLAKYPGRLIIKEFPASIVTMQDLMRHRDKLHSQGIRPKLFLNDYLDLMKLPKRKDARTDELLQLQYREFRGFAQESEAAAWSVSQSNKLNANKSIGVKEALAGAYAKGAEADFWGIIGRNNFDKLSNKAIFDIQKNRFGPDGMNFAAKFDTAHSLIEIYEEKSETGKKVKKEIISDSQMQLQYGAKQFELMANNRREDVNLF